MPAPPRVLVTGATGYIGGRLVPRLYANGYAVRCFARSTESFARPIFSQAKCELGFRHG